MHEKAKCVCVIYMQPQKVKFKSVQINMKQVLETKQAFVRNYFKFEERVQEISFKVTAKTSNHNSCMTKHMLPYNFKKC